jgi:hypothetical protein
MHRNNPQNATTAERREPHHSLRASHASRASTPKMPSEQAILRI